MSSAPATKNGNKPITIKMSFLGGVYRGSGGVSGFTSEETPENREVFVADRDRLLTKESLVAVLRENTQDERLRRALATAELSDVNLMRKSKKKGNFVELENEVQFADLNRSLTVKNHLLLTVRVHEQEFDASFTSSASSSAPFSSEPVSEILRLVKSFEELFNGNDVSAAALNLKALSNSISENLSNTDLFKNLSSLIELNFSKILKRIDELKQQQQKEEAPVSSPSGESLVHVGVVCDGCDKAITGVRYKCMECHDFDFCSACELAEVENLRHTKYHQMLKIKSFDKPRVFSFQGGAETLLGRVDVYSSDAKTEVETTVPDQELYSLRLKASKLDSLLEMIGGNETEAKKIEQLADLIEDFKIRSDIESTSANKSRIVIDCSRSNGRLLSFSVTSELPHDLASPSLELTISGSRQCFEITPHSLKAGQTLKLDLDASVWDDFAEWIDMFDGSQISEIHVKSGTDAVFAARNSYRALREGCSFSCVLEEASTEAGESELLEAEEEESDDSTTASESNANLQFPKSSMEFVLVKESEGRDDMETEQETVVSPVTESSNDQFDYSNESDDSIMDDYDILSTGDCE